MDKSQIEQFDYHMKEVAAGFVKCAEALSRFNDAVHDSFNHWATMRVLKSMAAKSHD